VFKLRKFASHPFSRKCSHLENWPPTIYYLETRSLTWWWRGLGGASTVGRVGVVVDGDAWRVGGGGREAGDGVGAEVAVGLGAARVLRILHVTTADRVGQRVALRRAPAKRKEVLLYMPTHTKRILGAAGHIILTPANQLLVMGHKIWSLFNPVFKPATF
jgi:hypothetical protein